MYQERRGCAVFRDVEVGDVDRQGDMLGTVGATGTNLCRETLDPPRWCKAPLQDGLLRWEGSIRESQTPALPPASKLQVKSSPFSLHPSDYLPLCAQRHDSETDPAQTARGNTNHLAGRSRVPQLSLTAPISAGSTQGSADRATAVWWPLHTRLFADNQPSPTPGLP